MERIIYFVGISLVISMASCSGPKAIFEMEVKDSSVPATVFFSNQTEKADSFLWYFGDGGISRDSSPQHMFYLSGRYPVTLEVFDGGKKGVMTKEIILTPPNECLVLMRTTMGDMLIKLYDSTPKHRDNFLKISEEGLLDSLLFHRVIEGFMIQGGDPDSKNAGINTRLGIGGPGYQIEAEFVDSLIHTKGALAAARQPDNVNPVKKSSGSQFYLVHGGKVSKDQLRSMSFRNGVTYTDSMIAEYENWGGTPQLDGNYTVFGKVLTGIEVIDKIAGVETNRLDRPIEDVRILEVKVIN